MIYYTLAFIYLCTALQLFVVYNCAGHSMEFVTGANSTNNARPYFCTMCDKRFMVKSYLNAHLQTHSVEKPFVCTVCDKRFTRKTYLNVHHKHIHNLNVHRKHIHNIENVYSCSECEKSFSSQKALTKHRYIHADKYKCTECGKCFSSGKDLERHKRSHSGEKPFKCSLCDYSFSRSDNLETHKRLKHSNRTPYLCFYCGKMFKTNMGLNMHVRIHTGTKLYSCEQCSECFMWLDQLKRHLLTAHDEGAWFVCNICE